jgi:two-component system nitrate/nitrite sensor histidine kinase NarX
MDLQIEPRPGGTADACARAADPGSGGPPHSVLFDFLGLVVRLTGARAGAIRAPTPDGVSLRLMAAVGLSEEVCARDTLMPVNCGMCGAALQSLLTRQATPAIGCAIHTDHAALAAFTGRAVAVPLDHLDKPIGVLNLFFAEGSDPPPGIAHLLRPFGQLLGLALENERLTRENLQAQLAAERQMMAADIHDALAQSLTFVRMRMSLLSDAIRCHDCNGAKAYWDDASDELRNAHGRLREIISLYRAGMASRGLAASLNELASVFRQRTGIELEFEAPGRDFDLTTEQQLQVFYILQEALANVARHSGAHAASLRIERAADELRFVVEDDGRGPAAEILDPRCAGRLTEAGHHGLQIMRERAGRAGGRLAIEALPDGGTRVTLALALAHTPAGAEGRAQT